VQLLPGQSFIGSSQRSVVTYGFFGAGSLVVRWTSLLFVPDIFGGNGSAGQPGYFAHYNLAEVTGYVGVLALMATFAFFTRVSKRGWKGAERDYVLYVVLLIVGLFATWGVHPARSPLSPHPPLRQHETAEPKRDRRGLRDDDPPRMVVQQDRTSQARRGRRRRKSEVVTMAPALGIVALCASLFFWGPQIVSYLGVFPEQEGLANDMHLSYGLHLVIALVAVLAIVFWRRRASLLRILLGVLCVDVVIFLVLAASASLAGVDRRCRRGRTPRRYWAPVAAPRSSTRAECTPSRTRCSAVPNMNVFTKIPSVQGYGSLESTNYDDATGTHPQAAVNPCRLADGTFTQLRLATIVVSTSQLGNDVKVRVPAAPNCKLAVATNRADRYFGQVLHVRTVTVHGRGGRRVRRTGDVPSTERERRRPGSRGRRERRQRHDLHALLDVAERAGFELDATIPCRSPVRSSPKRTPHCRSTASTLPSKRHSTVRSGAW